MNRSSKACSLLQSCACEQEGQAAGGRSKICVEMEEAQACGPAQATAGAVCWYARCRAGLMKPLVCSQCKAAAYCSKDCQVKDWKAGHKQACKGKMKKERDGAAALELTDIRLLVACKDGDMETVEKLLGKGASVDVQDKDGRTALMRASGHGHREVVEMLRSEINEVKGASMLRSKSTRIKAKGNPCFFLACL